MSASVPPVDFYACIPHARYYGCPQEYQDSLRIFYSVFAGIHALCACAMLLFVVIRLKREPLNTMNKIFAFASFSSFVAMIGCIIMTDSHAYGAPAWVMIPLQSVPFDILFVSYSLLQFLIMEVMLNKSLEIKSGIRAMRTPFLVSTLEHVAVSAVCLVVAGARPDLYDIFYRIYILHWPIKLLGQALFLLVFGCRAYRNTSRGPRSLSCESTIQLATFSVTPLLTGSIVTAIMVAHGGWLEYVEHTPGFFLFIWSAYRVDATLMNLIFLAPLLVSPAVRRQIANLGSSFTVSKSLASEAPLRTPDTSSSATSSS